MEIIVNYWAVIAATVVQFIIGMVWYGPLFGQKWMQVIGVDSKTKEEIRAGQKEAMPFYFITLIFSFITNYILYHFIKAWPEVTGVEVALWVWFGFVMPTQLGGVMWDNLPRKRMVSKFLLQAGYQLVSLSIIGYMFSIW